MSKKLFAGNGNPPPKNKVPLDDSVPLTEETDAGNGEPPPK